MIFNKIFNKKKTQEAIPLDFVTWETAPWDPEHFQNCVRALRKQLNKAQKDQDRYINRFLRKFSNSSDSDRITNAIYLIKQHEQTIQKIEAELFQMCQRFVCADGDKEDLDRVIFIDSPVNEHDWEYCHRTFGKKKSKV